jgi:hypothetical protein
VVDADDAVSLVFEVAVAEVVGARVEVPEFGLGEGRVDDSEAEELVPEAVGPFASVGGVAGSWEWAGGFEPALEAGGI